MSHPDRKERVLVTGANGFVGSHLVEALLEREYEVICFIQRSDVPYWIRELDVKFIYGDVTKKETLTEAVVDIDYIYHLSALLRGRDTNAIFRVNYEGTKNLVEVCMDSGVKLKRFLYTSSILAAGPTGKDGWFNEDFPCHPIDDYGRSKLMAEQYLNTMGSQIPYTIVRLPLVYGPRSFCGLFPFFKLLNKKIQFSFNEIQTNVVFVLDAAQGMIQAAENQNTVGKIFLLGEDRIYTYSEICQIISDALLKKPIKLSIPFFILYIVAFFCEVVARIRRTEPTLRRSALGSVFQCRYFRFDMQRATRVFGYLTRYPLSKGAKISARWYRERNLI